MAATPTGPTRRRAWGEVYRVRAQFSASLAALLGLLGGCHSPLSSAVLHPEPPPGAEKTLRIALGSEPQTLDPGLCSEAVSHEVIANLFAGLVELDPDTLEPLPELATRWEVDESGRHWLFELREAVWSDGTPLTAEDFVYSWRRVVDPQTGSRAASLLSVVDGAAAIIAGQASPDSLGVRALDAHTLEVTLAHRAPYFLQLLSQPVMRPVPRHVLGRLKAAGIDEARWTRPESLVTSGPFALERWRFKRDLQLRRSESYHDRKHVALARVRWTIVESAPTLANLFLTGGLDWTGINTRLPAPYIAQLKARDDFVTEPLLVSSFYWLNCTRGILRDARARRALSLAIDRSALTLGLLRGGEVPWAALVPPGLPGYPLRERTLFDPNQARTLWQAALADSASAQKEHAPLHLTLVYNTDDTNKQVAEAIQAMWAMHLGITVELINQEWQVFLSRVEARDFDIARLGWVGDFADPISFLRDVVSSETGNNASGLINRDFDRELLLADNQSDPARRLEALAAAEDTMLRAQPLIPLFTSSHASLMRPQLCGLGRNILGQHPLKFASWAPLDGACPRRFAPTP